ncbi:hypothetical protein IKF30_02200 [Candidatus Saccharibacteria bacterium]|nr:hypothetical protein [Candidatus Saccharibacteria bacterium]
MEEKHLKKPSNEVLKIEGSTNNVIMEVENMEKTQKSLFIDIMTLRVWMLYAAILGSSPTMSREELFSGDKPAVSSDEFEKLIAIINTLPKNARVVLILRFGLMDGKTRSLEDVGKELNITRERARQLEAKALRIMRSPSQLCKLPALFGFVPPVEPKSGIEDVNADTDIINLGLSIRTYNCLKQFAHIDTVGEILDYPKEDWPKIKNLGHKATLEIQERMRTVGYPEFSVE